MKITKFVHSCLLVEDQGQSILIDPGMFSKDAVAKADLKQVDSILITHEHADHFDIDALKQLKQKFPSVKITSNESVVEKLKTEGIEAGTGPPAGIKMEVVQHAELWGDMQPPLNSIYTIFDKLTDPGDRLDLTSTTEVLALPIFAPWGSFKWAMETAMKLKPKKIIPIHDWFLSDAAKDWHDQRAHETLDELGIEYIRLKDRPVEL